MLIDGACAEPLLLVETAKTADPGELTNEPWLTVTAAVEKPAIGGLVE